MNRNSLMRAFIVAAEQIASENAANDKQSPDGNLPATRATVLAAILTGRFRNDISEGKTLISSSEAGGSVSFSIDLGPSGVMDLCYEALTWCREQGDEDVPDSVGPRIKRLKAVFGGPEIPFPFI